LIDIASHVPVASVHSKRDESAGRYDDSTSWRLEASLLLVSDEQGQTNRPPPKAPTIVPTPYLDPAFLEHIIKFVSTGLVEASSTTHRGEKLVTPVH